MRIISRFHDYYDVVMKSGMDREVVYVRERKDIVLDDNCGIDFSTRNASSNHVVNTVLLGYCGQIFKVYTVKVSWSFGDRLYVFHKYDEFEEFMRINSLGSSYDFRANRWWPGQYARFEKFDTSKLLDLFHKYQTPLFIVSYEHHWRSKSKATITLGPSLKDLEFARVKDPFTAYQDIFQYVAGVLNRPENKMVEISDKDKVHKHGFDKWSFRQKGPKK